MKVSLRPMGISDLDKIVRIELTIYTHPWTRGNFSDSLNSGYSAWVLYDSGSKEGEIIGYALMMMVIDEVHLLNISVAKTHQKQGFGKLLLNYMMDKARAYGAANMFLEVRVSNFAAIRLYEGNGFNEMATRRAYYPTSSPEKNGREDALLMGIAL